MLMFRRDITLPTCTSLFNMPAILYLDYVSFSLPCVGHIPSQRANRHRLLYPLLLHKLWKKDLMMTVGTVYMSIPDAPIKEIMKDLMEMTRGVQHPTRGLFLRHYLSGMTRDHLPIGEDMG